MIGQAIDRVIGIFAPAWAAQRMAARATMSQLESFSGGANGYEAGKKNRLTKTHSARRINENAVPAGQVQRLRGASWEMYRNNPHARKLVRTLEAKVVGCGLQPQSQATKADGSPHVEFRRRAHELWDAVQDQIDSRGAPGKGGQRLSDLQRVALRAVILGGEVLYQPKPMDETAWRKSGLHIPLTIQLVDAERLDESLTLASSDGRIYRGIEIDAGGKRIAYHLYDSHPNDPLAMNTAGESTRYKASDIGHLYVAEDVDQLRGTPWFAPALMQMRDTNDYQYNELKSSALSACVMMGIRKPSGASTFGTAAPEGDDTEDGDGNALTFMQPGMIINLGQDGALEGFNPQRQGANAEAFIQHMLRSTACALPGVKSSTITGDYRKASFSSEKSADNDCWPEIEAVQEWFASGFTQPIYEEVVAAGIVAGWFEGVVTAGEFNERRHELLACHWQGPVALSINPTDDAEAARMRIRNGISSPQAECAQVGRNWRDVLKDIAEFTEYADELGIQPDLVQQYLGIDQIDSTQPGATGENPLNDPVQLGKQAIKAAA